MSRLIASAIECGVAGVLLSFALAGFKMVHRLVEKGGDAGTFYVACVFIVALFYAVGHLARSSWRRW